MSAIATTYSANDVFSSFHSDTLVFLASQTKAEQVKKLSTRQLIAWLTVLAQQHGVRQVCSSMRQSDLAQIIDGLDIEAASNRRVVLDKRLREYINKTGLEEFLNDVMTDDTKSDIIADVVEVDLDKRLSQRKKVRMVQHTIELIGVHVFFSSLSLKTLQQLVDESGIEVNSSVKSSKILMANTLVDHILPTSRTDRKRRESKPKQKVEKVSKHKPDIAYGVNYASLFQWYNVSELMDFCSDNGLKRSGRKKDVIQRILAYLVTAHKENFPVSRSNNTSCQTNECTTTTNTTDDDMGDDPHSQEQILSSMVDPDDDATDSFELSDDDGDDNDDGLSFTPHTLKDKVFVLTGSFKQHRNIVKRLLENHGAHVNSRVTEKVDFLITSDLEAKGEKMRKAKNLGIPIAHEQVISFLYANKD